jgi:predicted CoA-binding protein
MALIDDFFKLEKFVVYGASNNEEKYGTKVMKNLLKRGKKVYLVHPANKEMYGIKCEKSILDIDDQIDGVSIIIPPLQTRKVANDIIKTNAKMVWMQPGAEDNEAIKLLEENGIKVIFNQCVLMN